MRKTASLDVFCAAGKSGIILVPLGTRLTPPELAFIVNLAGTRARVMRREGQDASAAELSAFLGGRLAKYKIPKDYVFIDALPRTPYGKVVKGELTERYLREGHQS